MDGSSFHTLQAGKAYYYTTTYKELVVFCGVCDNSYRQVANNYNRIVYQKGALSYRTLQEQVQQQSVMYERLLKQKSEGILLKKGFDLSAKPQETFLQQEAIQLQDSSKLSLAFEQMYQQAPQHIQAQLVLDRFAYENNSVNISVDEVCVKEQKEHRKQESNPLFVKKSKQAPAINGSFKQDYRQRKFAYQTVIHLEKQGTYLLNGQSFAYLYTFMVAFLTQDDSLQQFWVFFTDGQNYLQQSIQNKLSWKRSVKIILDYYHLELKCQRQFFMALHKNANREMYLSELKQLLWYGLTKQAIDFLTAIPLEDIKNQEQLSILSNYIRRNQQHIPCYELRKRIGLRNSSNKVEQANNVLVAQRQKNKAMAWSKRGSIALGQVTSMKVNREYQIWSNDPQLRFSWTLAA